MRFVRAPSSKDNPCFARLSSSFFDETHSENEDRFIAVGQSTELFNSGIDYLEIWWRTRSLRMMSCGC